MKGENLILRSFLSLRALYRHRLGGLLAAACTLLVGIVTEPAATAQSRLPIKRIEAPHAYPVRDIEQGSDHRSFTMATPARLGNSLIAWILTDSDYGYPYLWSIDVVTGRSTLLKEISPLYDPVWLSQPFVPLAGRLYFSARALGDFATHLWSTDGTPEGTRQVQGPGERGFDFPTALTSFGGYLYFFSGTSENSTDTRLWRKW